MPATATTIGVILTPSGGSDDTTFVQNYLDTERCIAFKGIFPVVSLWSKYSGQVLSGIGSGHHTNTVELTSARSAFQYVGSQWVSGATDDWTILRVEPVSSASGYAQTGVRIDNIGFYGDGKAARGISWRSNRGGKVNAFIQSTRDAGFYTGVVAALNEFRDPQWNVFELIEVDQSTLGMGPCVWLDGDITANTSVNDFAQILARYNDNDGVVIANTDHNSFGLIRCLHSSLTPGWGLRFKASNTDNALTARDNLILNASVGLGGCLSEGNASGTFPALNNTITFYDSTNGSPSPTIETGSILWWRKPEQPMARQMIAGVLPA